MYYPKFRAKISYTIPRHVLVYSGAKMWDRLSSFLQRSRIWALGFGLSQGGYFPRTGNPAHFVNDRGQNRPPPSINYLSATIQSSTSSSSELDTKAKELSVELSTALCHDPGHDIGPWRPEAATGSQLGRPRSVEPAQLVRMYSVCSVCSVTE